jgi:dolichol-phosphate mannosyltransferase
MGRENVRMPAGETSVVPPRDLELSIVVPVFNEEESIPPLCEHLFSVLKRQPCSFEVIIVNDGSSDASFERLRAEAVRRTELTIINLRRNYGQTAALMAGIDHANGRIIVTMDADLQNDPEDIPLLVDKIGEGYDVVSGWRRDRKDAKISRNFVSLVGNLIISRISGLKLNDYGCTLKAYRHDVLEGVRLYGEMHRFIPIYASWMGANVCEIPVRHCARQFGSSKYGLERIFKVILDLTVLKFFDRFLVKPIYVFGGVGLIMVLTSFAALALALGLRIFKGISLILTPLPLLASMLFLMGCTSVLMGLMAEMLMRTYFESQGRRSYRVRELINFGPSS